MRNIILSVVVTIALFEVSCNGSSEKNSNAEVAAVSSIEESLPDVADKQLAANGRPVILDFSAEWCPPCRKLKPIFAALKDEYAGKVDFVTINVDSMPEISAKYQVSSIPTLVYLDAEGKETFRTVGFRSAEEIKSDIGRILN